MLEESRRAYRTQTTEEAEITVEVIQGKKNLPAQVHDVSIGGLGLLIKGENLLRAGSTVQVKITAPSLEEPLLEYAKIRYVKAVEGGSRVGLEFIDWLGLIERVPMGLCELFNRRTSPRKDAHGKEKVQIYYESEGAATSVEAKLVNLSSQGLAFLVDSLTAARLLRAELVLLSFRLPGTGTYLSFRAQLRHLREEGTDWLLGAYFDEEGYMFEERKAELARYIGENASMKFPT